MSYNVEEIEKDLRDKGLVDCERRVKRWPKKSADKKLILEYIQSKFELYIKYSEKEVNEIILKWQLFDDYALIRREMYENCLINRTNDCRKYWIEEET
jgi:hypothetical protein